MDENNALTASTIVALQIFHEAGNVFYSLNAFLCATLNGNVTCVGWQKGPQGTLITSEMTHQGHQLL